MCGNAAHDLRAAEVRAIAGRDRAEVLQAFHHTERRRPSDAFAFFRSKLKQKIQTELVDRPQRTVSVPDDPYGGS
jgi:hypothetical protein